MEIGKVCRLRKSLYGLKRSPRGLVNSAKQLRSLACKRVNLTTQSSTGTPFRYHFVGNVCR